MQETRGKWGDCLPKEDSFEARQYRRGFTLVPCWVTTPDGERVRGCKWVKNAPSTF